jgi:hypothetical protein
MPSPRSIAIESERARLSPSLRPPAGSPAEQQQFSFNGTKTDEVACRRAFAVM